MNSQSLAKSPNFFSDLYTIAKRALRLAKREFEYIIPAIVIPVFFFVINVAALSKSSSFLGIVDYKAFQLPVGIIFAVTGVSRAPSLVTDIQGGYFDKLLISPVNRRALLLGLMVADFVVVMLLCIPVVILGLIVGVSFATGILGILAFVLIGSLWGVAFTGFGYAIALKTGNPGAVNSSFIMFFPFVFLTTSFMPKKALSGWLSKVSDYNPVTYLLEALRGIITTGWDWNSLSKGLLAILLVAFVSQTLAFWALNSRTKAK